MAKTVGAARSNGQAPTPRTVRGRSAPWASRSDRSPIPRCR